jgi:ribonucleoside-diphosphate reductase alpha chain
MLIIEYLDETADVYDITVDLNHNFFANGILVHNCTEVSLPVKPINNVLDESGEVATCILSALNWGKFKNPEDMQKYCELSVRALDLLIDYQMYPIPAAELSTKARRSLGVGIINYAYWLAKNGMKYDDSALVETDKWMQHMSYYLIKASNDLAKEVGACSKSNETMYSLGVLPIDTRKDTIDTVVPYVEYLDWQTLRDDCKQYGIRNSVLMAIAPTESSAVVSNATNGIEPPRAFVTTKISKNAIMKQVVPEITKLKNKYDLLWDQKNPEGYLKLVAVMQKYLDQSISVNTSYNPKRYQDGKIPTSELLKHIILSYRLGLKSLYYNNTNDSQGEEKPEDLDAICETCSI